MKGASKLLKKEKPEQPQKKKPSAAGKAAPEHRSPAAQQAGRRTNPADHAKRPAAGAAKPAAKQPAKKSTAAKSSAVKQSAAKRPAAKQSAAKSSPAKSSAAKQPRSRADADAIVDELIAQSRAKQHTAVPPQSKPAKKQKYSRQYEEVYDETDAYYDDDLYYDDDEYYDDDYYDDYDDDLYSEDDASYGDSGDADEFDYEYDEPAAEPDSMTEAADSPDGMLPETAASAEGEAVMQKQRRFSAQSPRMTQSEAEDLYRRVTHDSMPFLKQLSRETERNWKKETSQIQAKIKGDRASRVTSKVNIAVCLTMLFGVAIGMLVLKRPTVSMEENRNLAKMPEFSVDAYLSGEYTNGVSEYYNDTVPFRSTFKTITQSIRQHMGLSGGPVLHLDAPLMLDEDDHGEAAAQTTPAAETTTTTLPAVTAASGDAAEIEVTTTKATTTTAATEKETEKEEGGKKEGEISNNILVVNNRGIMLFGAGETHGENYANILNRFQQDLPGVQCYNLTIPTVCSFYTPDEFKNLIRSEKKNLDYINNHLEGVLPVDAYSALEAHKDEPIFMRTDHHWSSLGAFYAAEKFAQVARVPFARIEEYERRAKNDYVGTLYGYSGDITLKQHPEEFFWYIPKANYTTTYYNSSLTSSYQSSFFLNIENRAPVGYYMVYMAGDDHMVHVHTELNSGRKLAVIKDSYGNALIPWLTSSFDDIYVIDMRYFKVNAINFIKEKGVTDVVFCMNSFSANGGNGRKIDTIRTQ